MHHVHILWKYCKLADAKDPCKSHDVSLSLPSKHDIIEMIIWPKFQKDVVMKRSIIILDDPQSYSGKREVHFSGSNSKAIPRQGRSLHIGLEGKLNVWFSSNFKMGNFSLKWLFDPNFKKMLSWKGASSYLMIHRLIWAKGKSICQGWIVRQYLGRADHYILVLRVDQIFGILVSFDIEMVWLVKKSKSTLRVQALLKCQSLELRVVLFHPETSKNYY